MACSGDVVADLEKEQRHFEDVFQAFAFYRTYAKRRIEKSGASIASLPAHHRAMLEPAIGKRQQLLNSAVDWNDGFVREMLRSSRSMFVNSAVSHDAPEVDPSPDRSSTSGEQASSTRGDQAAAAATRLHHHTHHTHRMRQFASEPSTFTMEKVATTLKQFYRDWSQEGEEERNTCYQPLIDELHRCYPTTSVDPDNPPRVLVPGAGLGRLTFEIARRGYECQGNEFSMHMLMASNFIINRPVESKQLTIYPWLMQFCNNYTAADQLQAIQVPDVSPASVPDLSGFSMCAGDFLQVYTEPEQWECVVTCFFIDTAHNPIDYIECIHRILVPGGYWINLGPLLWHWNDVAGELSIELSYEELRRVITDIYGFIMHKEDPSIRTGYIQNPRSMMKTLYDCVLFVAQKPLTMGGRTVG